MSQDHSTYPANESGTMTEQDWDVLFRYCRKECQPLVISKHRHKDDVMKDHKESVWEHHKETLRRCIKRHGFKTAWETRKAICLQPA